MPELALGALSPPQTQFTEKFGGLPWGLPTARWPLCRECGNPQTHLATFIHSAERLDLGAEGRVVMVFQCGYSPNETNCANYDADSGANAVVFLDAHELGIGITEPPDPGAPKGIEMRVTNWVEQYDLVTAESEPSFYKADGWYDEVDEAREAVDDSIGDCAKMGSVPCWMQEPEEVDPAFRFAAQLAMYYHFPDPIPSADDVGVVVSVGRPEEDWPLSDPRRWDPSLIYDVQKPAHPDPALRGHIYFSDLTLKRYGSGFDVEAVEFGDGGKGFLFVHPDPLAPRGLFLWQCG